MMGTIVLSMLLGWFGAVAVLTVWAGRAGDVAESVEGIDRRDGGDALTEQPQRATGAPRLATEEL